MNTHQFGPNPGILYELKTSLRPTEFGGGFTIVTNEGKVLFVSK
jgi:hypothetical protein